MGSEVTPSYPYGKMDKDTLYFVFGNSGCGEGEPGVALVDPDMSIYRPCQGSPLSRRPPVSILSEPGIRLSMLLKYY